MGRYDERWLPGLQHDFSRGIISRISEFGGKNVGRRGNIDHVKSADNCVHRPRGAIGPRPGYRDTSTGTLPEPGHSVGKYYSTGGNRRFVATNSGGGNGKLYRGTGTVYTQQTTPDALTDQRMIFAMVNGVLIATQMGGTGKPIFFDSTNPADTWLSCVLPKPAQAPTFGADQVGGSLTVTKDYFYRVRWTYKNGSSKTSPVSAAHQVVAASGNYKIRVQNLTPAAQGGTARTDWVGWTLERSKSNGSALGPFYTVTDGTAATYDDGAADADLFTQTDETLHGEPVHLEGIIGHKGRLFGWAGSNLYVSQPITGPEATGIFNFVGDLIYPVSKDDGDTIQSCVVQSGRLVIGKRGSISTLEGDDPLSFVMTTRVRGAGFCGPRAACSIGSTIYFAGGNQKLFRWVNSDPIPIGQVEVGDYLVDMSASRDSYIVLENYAGEYVLFSYTRKGDTVNGDMLALDLLFGGWDHWNNFRVADMLVHLDEDDSNRQSLLWCDPSPVGLGIAVGPAFAVWDDDRAGATRAVYVQRIELNGAPAWAGNGVAASAALSNTNPLNGRVIDDGAGGCIVAFRDPALGRGRAQRFNASGVAQWAAGGVDLGIDVPIDVSTNSTFMVSDGAAGAIIFGTKSAGGFLSAHAVQVSSSGAIIWTTNLRAAPSTADAILDCCPDGAGGAYVCWVALPANDTIWYSRVTGAGSRTFTNNTLTARNRAVIERHATSGAVVAYTTSHSGVNAIDARRIDGTTGAPIWTTVLYQLAPGPYGLSICLDGIGGHVVGWTDGSKPYVQRLDAAGSVWWGGANGLALCSVGTTLSGPTLVPDNLGGCLAVWSDNRSGTLDVLAQRVSVVGTLQWGTNGVTVSGATNVQDRPKCCTDGDGGLIVLWQDARTGGVYDIYAQRMDKNGAAAWTADGVLFCSATGNQLYPFIYFAGAENTDAVVGGQSVPNYHLWTGFNGTQDARDADGSNGVPIPLMFETPDNDDGYPDQDKDYDRIEFFIAKGTGLFVATLFFEADGVPAITVPIESNPTGPTYDSGFLYDNGVLYGSEGAARVTSGIPRGTIARSYKVRVSAALTDNSIIQGYALDRYLLPRRQFSGV